MDNPKAERARVFRRFLLRMAEGSHRERQQAGQAVYTQRDGHQHRHGGENRQDKEENQRQTEGKTQFLDTG